MHIVRIANNDHSSTEKKEGWERRKSSPTGLVGTMSPRSVTRRQRLCLAEKPPKVRTAALGAAAKQVEDEAGVPYYYYYYFYCYYYYYCYDYYCYYYYY